MIASDSKTKAFTGLRAPRTQSVILCRRNLHLVGRVSKYAREACVVIAMPLHNQARTLRAALESALAQKLSAGHCAVVLLDDQSTDDWQREIHDLLAHPALIVLGAQCGNAALARNAILDFVDSQLPNATWIARLDPDDLLCSEASVESLRSAGDRCGSNFVLGSNYLSQFGQPVYPDNIANRDMLLDRKRLTNFIEEFCEGRANNELPSCNLLIRARQGIRYPLLESAEDHWLVAQLLMFRPEHAAIVPYPVYCRYSLNGDATTNNQLSGAHRQTREFLARAARIWFAATAESGQILGHGMEGCVLKIGDKVVKRFYPGAMTVEEIARLADCACHLNGRLPQFEWSTDEAGAISCHYDWVPHDPIGCCVLVRELHSFLLDFARAGVVPSNIKRENLRLSDERLVYIDIGRDVKKFTPSYFLDSAARLYALCILGFADGELARRLSFQEQHESLGQLEGFDGFYRDLIAQLYPMVQLSELATCPTLLAPDVTLMIKACPQDHAILTEQVAHIVAQLTRPRAFAKVVLAVDPHLGSYLRQYAEGDFRALMESAGHLLSAGMIDAIWTAPQDQSLIENLFARWFGIRGIRETHTHSGAPVFAQLWAFEQVSTRYVLQCDLDVLVGRKDYTHDYLPEMLKAIEMDRTWCVGFNIAKRHAGFIPYASRAEGFVPEIRLGLLDLQKIQGQLPFVNTSIEGHIVKMWHRSMQDAQRETGMQSVRGGDDRTFYVHPCNETKGWLDMDLARDLVGQGRFPAAQAEKWDMVCDANWHYQSRPEHIVFLLMGRNTPKEKLQRCVASLAAQTDQDFGVILIDDDSEPLFSWKLDEYVGSIRDPKSLGNGICILVPTMVSVTGEVALTFRRECWFDCQMVLGHSSALFHGLRPTANRCAAAYCQVYWISIKLTLANIGFRCSGVSHATS